MKIDELIEFLSAIKNDGLIDEVQILRLSSEDGLFYSEKIVATSYNYTDNTIVLIPEYL